MLQIMDNPHNSNYYFILYQKGLALADTNNYEDAIDCFDKAIKHKPDFFDAWCSRAYLEKEEGDWEISLQNYNKALEIDPSSAEIWFERAELISFMEGDDEYKQTKEDLIAAYDDLIKNCVPDDCYYPMAIYLRSGELYLIGKYEESLESYNLVLKVDPNNENAWEGKGDVLKKLGRFNESELCYEVKNKILKETEEQCVMLLRKLGRYDLIASDWQTLIEKQISPLPKIHFSTTDIDHNQIIYVLAKIALAIGLQVHIGKQEQSTGKWNGESFRDLSLPNLPIDKPLTEWERGKIQQIDIIWFESENPVYAFEVEKSTPITTRIDRFMELLSVFPNIAKKIGIIIPAKRLSKMNKILKYSRYIGHPLYMENKLMYSFSDRIAKMYQDLSSEKTLELEKVLQVVSSYFVSPLL
ncbi:tetratricopeptide repeat protein [Pseudanabaena sp. ABRG5-3]|uniref:tetratricopeptide repeat protein n=1 Tax=Pseudanabaena sp. ABRG5-3 TaxID=685565 RepID=UPI000DC71132|nr:tetratricopeptide repeat protein [Pseudanabaena sp. ABRG5-3]BBC23771.1 tetratricopeptide repeat domain protein [Pseudanabaena sp. ABRG5-3]